MIRLLAVILAALVSAGAFVWAQAVIEKGRPDAGVPAGAGDPFRLSLEIAIKTGLLWLVAAGLLAYAIRRRRR